MFRVKNLFILAMLGVCFSGISAADKEVQDYINDLKAGEEQKVLEAAKYLGKEKEKEAIEPIIDAIKFHGLRNVRIALVDALGRMDEKGRPTSALKELIETDKDNHVIYTALLAILNLKDFENEDAKKALDYCDQNKKDDIFIADAVAKIKARMAAENE